uniref:C-type lectin domain-containing protein n=1 Tax=Macrostomum lignano TaxID=282301 RepID=A0A1I8J1Q6_9PLAT
MPIKSTFETAKRRCFNAAADRTTTTCWWLGTSTRPRCGKTWPCRIEPRAACWSSTLCPTIHSCIRLDRIGSQLFDAESRITSATGRRLA